MVKFKGKTFCKVKWQEIDTEEINCTSPTIGEFHLAHKDDREASMSLSLLDTISHNNLSLLAEKG